MCQNFLEDMFCPFGCAQKCHLFNSATLFTSLLPKMWITSGGRKSELSTLAHPTNTAFASVCGLQIALACSTLLCMTGNSLHACQYQTFVTQATQIESPHQVHSPVQCRVATPTGYLRFGSKVPFPIVSGTNACVAPLASQAKTCL
jgi:hypothetical protein